MVVFSGDGDLFAIGGNHFIHAARRNMDLTVICVNNLNYGMTGGQAAATTPHLAKTSTTPLGNPEAPFNLPLLAYACGATYIARWTMLHTRDLTQSITEALTRTGFSFIEVLAPCPTGYGRKNKLKASDLLKVYQEKAIVKNGANPAETILDLEQGITLGKFVEYDRPTFAQNYAKIIPNS